MAHNYAFTYSVRWQTSRGTLPIQAVLLLGGSYPERGTQRHKDRQKEWDSWGTTNNHCWEDDLFVSHIERTALWHVKEPLLLYCHFFSDSLEQQITASELKYKVSEIHLFPLYMCLCVFLICCDDGYKQPFTSISNGSVCTYVWWYCVYCGKVAVRLRVCMGEYCGGELCECGFVCVLGGVKVQWSR